MPGYRMPRKSIPSSAQPRSRDSRIVSPASASSRVAQKRRRRIGAHAAGVQAQVAVQRAFVVLRGRKQLRRLAVAKRVQRNLHAFQKFLDDNVRARRAKGFADQDFVNRPCSLRPRWRKSKRLCRARGRRLSRRICRRATRRISSRRRHRQKFRRRAVGMPYFSMNFCEKTLDDSNCAAFWFGPQMRRPFF